MNPDVFCPLKDYGNCGNCGDNCQGKRQILETKDFIYIVNGKAGSTSIIKTIGGKTKYVTKEYLLNSDKFKFTFVRDPLTRLVSGWGTWITVRREWLNKHPKLSAGMSFKEFIKVLGKMDDNEMNLHFAPQTLYTTIDDVEICDFIGKLENIKEDWEELSKQIKLPPIKHTAKGPVKNHFMKYDDETVKIVRERYKEEIKKFGYENTFEEWKQ